MSAFSVARGLPYGHDSEIHLYRTLIWDAQVRQGLLFTRWSPLLGHGYGFPLFHYYPPLFYALAQPWLLLGLDAAAALRWLLALALIGAATGMQRWAGALFGPGAGSVAAAAFVCSPYLLYTLIGRASFPEVLALALLPWACWGLLRHAQSRSCGSGLLAALALGAMLLSHLFSGCMAAATLLFYAAGLALVTEVRGTSRLRYLAHLLWPVALGLGLAAFAWVPALLETELVQIERVLQIADPATGAGLMPPWQALAGPFIADRDLAVAVIPPRLSPVAGALALAGLLTGLVALQAPLPRLHLWLSLVALNLLLLLISPLAGWLWQQVDLLRLSQFPFRLLGVASLWLALLAGAGAAALLALLMPAPSMVRATGRRSAPPRSTRVAQRARQLMSSVVGTILCLLLALPVLTWPDIALHRPGQATLRDALHFERSTPALGLVSAGEYLPRTVEHLPPPRPIDAGSESLVVTQLPGDAHLHITDSRQLAHQMEIRSSSSVRLTFAIVAFSGWQATIDEQPVPIEPTAPHGLISLDVPPGAHTIALRFGSTPLRQVANMLSLISALTAVLLTLRLYRSRVEPPGRRRMA